MAKPIHMMVRVRDEERSVDFYRRAFGLEIAQRVDFPDFTLVYMREPAGGFEVELTVNKDRAQHYSLGDGYGHLAFVVDDLEAERARMTAQGLAPKDIKQMNHDGKTFGKFFFIEDPDGYKIEVLQKGGRFQ
jgi:lactoylglutathione lyase